MGKIYVAYGSNMNVKQMGIRCPTATRITTGWIEGYELLFKGATNNAYATIEPNAEANVDVVLWEIEETDERHLDRYEGYPQFYTKENVTVQMSNGCSVEGMVYVMDHAQKLGMPSMEYFKTVLEGYLENDIDPVNFVNALANSFSKQSEVMEPVQKMEM